MDIPAEDETPPSIELEVVEVTEVPLGLRMRED